MVPHFRIVLLVSLITLKRIELITRDWSQFEDILVENMINYQNEGWGPLGDPTGAPKFQKMTKILNFLGFATIQLTQVEYFCYSYTYPMRRE